MKVVYSLRSDTQHIADVQAASLSPKPFGIRPSPDLFGSAPWWKKVESGLIAASTLTGTITKLSRVGMHNDTATFEMRTSEGGTFEYDCVASTKRDRRLYRVGAEIEFSYVLQPLKDPSRALPGRGGCVLCPIEIKLDAEKTA